jgi:hypothetical protein
MKTSLAQLTNSFSITIYKAEVVINQIICNCYQYIKSLPDHVCILQNPAFSA